MRTIYLWMVGLLILGLGYGWAPAAHVKLQKPVQVAKPAPVPHKPKKTTAQNNRAFSLKVDVTYYQALPGQTDADPDTAACGPNLRPWLQVALSRDLFIHPNGSRRCGQRVRLRFSDGQELVGIVNDTMHQRFRKRVDVLVPSGDNAMAYGRTVAQLDWN